MSKKKPARPRRSESRDKAAEFNTRIVSALSRLCDEADQEMYGAYCAGFSQGIAGTLCGGLSPSDEAQVSEVVAYAMGQAHGTMARAQPGNAINQLSPLRDVVAAVCRLRPHRQRVPRTVVSCLRRRRWV